MKKLLPLLKNLLVKDLKYFSISLILLVLFGISNKSQAQVYYMTNDVTSGSTSAIDGINRMDYSGANATLLANSFTVSPALMAIDLPNNRAFVYEAFSASPPTGLSIKVVNLTSGAVTATIPITGVGARCYSVKYDPINDYIYYIVADSSPTTATTDDALYKVKPDGTGKTVVISAFSKNPNLLALDIIHNKAYVYNQLVAEKKLLTIDLSNGTVIQTGTITAATTGIYSVNDIGYDADTDYIYYLSSNGATTTNANDALSKIHPDGTGYAVITSVAQSPTFMALDAGNNRAFVFDNVAPARTISSINLSTGATVVVKSLSDLAGSSTVTSLWVPYRAMLTTTAPSSVSASAATLGGNILKSDVSVTERGVVYSTSNATPTIGGSGVTKASNGTGTGSFSQSIGSLSVSATYYVRSYATSTAGTAYGDVTTFSTPSNDATLSGLSISAGTLTPSFSSGTISYTASVANANSTITITATKNNASASLQINNVAATSGTGASVSLVIGDNAIPIKVTAQDGSTKIYTITVNRPKVVQTITFAATNTKTYGDGDFAPGATASSGLGVSYSSDNLGVATIVSGQIHIVGAGTANITASQAGDANNLAASNVVQALTVNKASQAITFNALTAKTYGNADFAPGATTSSGLTVSYSSDNTAVATIVSNQIHIVGQGSANITASQAGDANRLAATSVAQVLTVNKATITVTANAQTKVYGNADPAFTYTATGVVGSDAPTGALSRVTPNTNRLVGDYAINQGDISYGSNYNITYVGANLTITKRPLTIAPLPVTKQYGDPDFATGAPYSFSGTSIAAEDGMSGTFGRTPNSENAGTYALTIGLKHPLDASTGEDRSANYNISFITNTFTITPKPVTVNANAQTKTYGDADPTLSYVNDSLPFGDTFSGSLTRAPGEGFGTYAITQGALALSSNYTLTFNGNNLTIGKKTINVTANAKTKTYGAADPAFDYTYDALSFSDGFTGTLTRDAGEGVGNHAITQGSLALSSNYTLNYTGANLSIGKSTLTYVATPASRPYLTTDPTYTGSVTGFVNGDNLASATSGTLSFATTANINSPLGNYPIVGSGLSAANYDFVQDASNSTALTITPSIDATLANLTVDQGILNPVFSSEQTSYGFAVANNVASFNLTATANQQNATLQFNGGAITSGIATNVPLNTGPNNFNVIVTAQDGSTTKYYTLNIFRAYDTNNLLASLNLSGVTYSPSFDANTLNYTASVSNVVTSTDVTATAVSPTTHVFVGGYDLATTNPVNTSLNVGETDVIIVSKAENGDERIYKVAVTRAQSADATLASIGNNTITLNTPFVSGTHTYSATVASGVGALTFLPTATNNAAIIKVNNQNLNTGGGNNVPLSFGANSVVIDVTSENGLNHIPYVLNIYRLRSSDATLASLSFPFITSLNEEFNPNVYDYTATVADSTYTGIPLSAISANENAIVKIDGTVVPRFINYTLPVHGGPNTYHVVVTSQDTSATKTYTLVLTRAGTPPPLLSPVANLYALNVSSGSSFSKNFNFTIGEQLTTIYAPNNIASVRVFAVSENEVSTVTVNGVTLPYDTTTDLLPISVGDNEFTVVVTSQDGAHSKTYVMHVTRLPFADVTLASLSVNAGTLTPAFVPATRSYTVSVPNNITSIGVTPVATVGTATIQIGATQISASNPTVTVNLSEGPPNRIRVVVTAADGVTTQTYTINVTREAPVLSNIASVSNFTLDPVSSLVSTTGAAGVNYVTSVSAGMSSISLKTTAQQADATIRVNGNVVTSGVFSDPIALNAGPTVINISITAQDGVTVKTYSITVNRTGSNNALASFNLDPASTLLTTTGSASVNYVTSVSASVSSISLKTIAQQADAVIRVNGNVVTSGVLSDPIALNAGPTVINISITAQDGVTVKTYSITVNRTGSNNALVSGFSLDPGSSFFSTTGSASVNYVTSVSAGVSSISLKTTAQQADAVIRVNGNVVASGVFSGPIALNNGPTVINISITAQDGVTVKTYSITVNRTGSNNALANFSLDPVSSLFSTTGSASVNYIASVSAGVSSISLKTTAQQADAEIRVNGNIVTNGVFSGPIALNSGATVINISITAQDGVTVKTYSITINRTGSNIASVSNFTLDPASTLLTTTGDAGVNYVTSVSAGVSSVSLKTTAQQADATIRVNGNVVTSAVFSDPIALNSGPTVINISITAQDGVTVKTYSITINRTGSNIALVSGFILDPASTLLTTTGSASVNYVASVSAGVSSVSLKTIAQQADAVIRVNDNVVTNGVFSDPIALNSGPTVINISITAQDGVTVKTYSITVNRTGSNNALANFSLDPVSSLLSTTGSASVNYVTSVSPGVSSISLKTIAQQADAVIRVNGNVVTNGVFSDPIVLNAGPTVINISITAQDGVTVKTYSITVNRTGSNNASASLAFNPKITLTSTTGVGNVNYMATVSETQSSIRVIPTVYYGATVTINGAPVTGGTASDPISLIAGQSTMINVFITAEDGITTRTYTVNVSRPLSLLMVDKNDSKLLFANKAANNVAPTDDDGVVVHQGVSPNGDGSNDFLYIEGISAYPGNKLSIMNTSGTLVFDVKDYGKDGNHLFDGHSNKNGALLKPGTYFYALEYQVDKQSKRKTGYIIIKY
ncbi:MAG: cadherin-like beta sandwich domain-containing protein [Bacteroidota bacterium]